VGEEPVILVNEQNLMTFEQQRTKDYSPEDESEEEKGFFLFYFILFFLCTQSLFFFFFFSFAHIITLPLSFT